MFIIDRGETIQIYITVKTLIKELTVKSKEYKLTKTFLSF